MKVCELLVTKFEGQVIAGRFYLLGNKIVAKPASPAYKVMMGNILSYPVRVQGKKYTATANPEEWISNLPVQYDGSRVRARLVTE